MKNQVKNLIIKFILLIVLSLYTTFLQAQTNLPDWQWALNAGSFGSNYGHSIALDSDGNSYITGEFQSHISFGNINLTTSGNFDLFVAKINNRGQWIWAVNAGTEAKGLNIITDKLGNSYITGSFMGIARFGSINLKSFGYRDAFIAKIDSNGQWLWAVNAGGKDNDAGRSVTVDSLGDVYITGLFQFDANFGNITLTSSGSNDIFVAKLNSKGEWQWAVKAGGKNYNDNVQDIALDQTGNILITGDFQEILSFGMIDLISTKTNWADIFVAKLDTGGKWLWAVSAGGKKYTYSRSLCLDKDGNAYITGQFGDTVIFGNIILPASKVEDVFVAKINNNGMWIWAVKANINGIGTGQNLGIDNSGSIYITGSLNGTADFDSTYLITKGKNNIYVAKLDTTGKWQWAIMTSGNGGGYGRGLAIDTNNNIYLTGIINDTINFGNINLTSTSNINIFIAKLSKDKITDLIECEEKTIVKLYPNPATNILTIETSKAINSPIIITDMTGRQVMQVKNLNQKTIDLDISSLEKGLYFVHMNNESYKFIKQQ